jgi:DNA polymerase III epsilon subunit-like protein
MFSSIQYTRHRKTPTLEDDNNLNTICEENFEQFEFQKHHPPHHNILDFYLLATNFKILAQCRYIKTLIPLSFYYSHKIIPLLMLEKKVRYKAKEESSVSKP